MEVVELRPDNPGEAARGNDRGYGLVRFDDGKVYRYFGNVYYADRIRFRFQEGWRVVEEFGQAVEDYTEKRRKML